MKTQEHNTGTVVAPAQTNYGEYTLPPTLTGLDDLPLYMVVAIWGWQRGRPFCREDLAKAFRITLKQAGDVMSYIRRADQKKIQSRQGYERLMKGVRCRYMQIVAEPDRTVKKALRGKPTPVMDTDLPQDNGPLSDAGLQALRRWFLTRPNPG